MMTEGGGGKYYRKFPGVICERPFTCFEHLPFLEFVRRSIRLKHLASRNTAKKEIVLILSISLFELNLIIRLQVHQGVIQKSFSVKLKEIFYTNSQHNQR